ncbi:MAG: hypothetical protein KC940_22755, partial [Candidatus Omnitrophica bacterium]|nr:hypothetical protein [Candidatus Omnitrophota bacterium]
RNVRLSRTAVNGEGIDALASCPNLEDINLYGCKVEDSAMPLLAKISSLRSLDLSKTRITNDGLSALAGHPNLRRLTVDNTEVDSGCIPALVTIPHLENFSFMGTPIQASDLGSLPSLKLRTPDPNAPKIGVIFSHVSANNPRTQSSPNGYGSQQYLATLCAQLGFNVYAVIDPDGEVRPDLEERLGRWGLMDKTVVVTDEVALRSLDVIASGHDPNQTVEGIDSILSAVKSGVGFFNISIFSFHDPGFTAEVQELLGVVNGYHHFRSGDYPCEVIASHPIMGAIEPGNLFWISMENGLVGPVDGIPLLRSARGSNPDFTPLYVRELGEGRVVCCQWTSYKPKDTPPYTTEQFFGRCFNWAAKRPVGESWIQE